MTQQKKEMETIVLSHGSGGQLSQDLFQTVFAPAFKNPFLNEVHDGAIVEIGGCKIAFSTDSYVVNPLFFPGGNIGDLAVNGTVNDISMCGAKPLYLSVGFILEEGFGIDQLNQIVHSMKLAAQKAGVMLVTGDTKVVEKGNVDGVYINTAGIGLVKENTHISPKKAKAGDVIIINGKIAQHGIAIMSKREGLDFETDITSDSAALNHLVERILDTSSRINVLRDPTRGGLSATLNEIAESSKVGILLHETQIPIDEQVGTASALLGLDPLYIANEGKMLVIVDPGDADQVLEEMKQLPEGAESAIIGEVTDKTKGKVILETELGTKRIVDMPTGEQLPRIC